MVTQPTTSYPFPPSSEIATWPGAQDDNLKGTRTLGYSDDASEPTELFSCQLFMDGATDYIKQHTVQTTGSPAYFVVGKFSADDSSPPHWGVLGCYLTKDAEGTTASDTIRFSIQITDARASASADALAGRRRVTVIVSTSSFGAPAGTQTVAAGSTGLVLVETTADQVLECETDANGLLEIDITVSGAGDRFVRAYVGDSEPTELQGTWAA